MTKVEKVISKFLREPAPRDLTWQELCKVMRSFGFDWDSPSGGSHGYFIDSKKRVIKPAVKPHGRGEAVIPVYQINNYKEQLRNYGLLPYSEGDYYECEKYSYC